MFSEEIEFATFATLLNLFTVLFVVLLVGLLTVLFVTTIGTTVLFTGVLLAGSFDVAVPTVIDVEMSAAEISSALLEATILVYDIVPYFPETPDFVLKVT